MSARKPKAARKKRPIGTIHIATAGSRHVYHVDSLVNQISAVRKEDPELNAVFVEAMAKQKEADLIIQAKADFFDLRNEWSSFVKKSMALLIIFQLGLILGVGMGILNFEKYTWLVPTVLIEMCAQVLGLGYLVVKCLFGGADLTGLFPKKEHDK